MENYVLVNLYPPPRLEPLAKIMPSFFHDVGLHDVRTRDLTMHLKLST